MVPQAATRGIFGWTTARSGIILCPEIESKIGTAMLTTALTADRHTLIGAWVFALGLALFAATGAARADETERKAIDAAADLALQQLFAEDQSAKQLSEKAVAMLVFPKITKAGLGIGGEGGKGVLRKQGMSEAYYRTRSLSIGAQAGAQTYGTVILFMTQTAYESFTAKDKGYEIGVDGSVAVVETGASGKIDSANIKSDIVAIMFNESGLMASLSIEGSKITRLDI